MARSRKKSSGRTTPDASGTTKDAEDTATASGKDPVGRRAKGAAEEKATGKDATEPTKKGTKKATKKATGTSEDEGAGRTPGGEVAEKAKDSTRTTSVRRAAQAESARKSGRRVAAVGQNPQWLAPTAVVFLIVGLAYLVTYYISAGQLPLPIGDWNLAVGFGVLMVGGGMLMFWK